MGRIHLSPPDMGDAERRAVLRAFDSNWITTLGPEVDGFEAEIADYTGAPAAAALASGTAALHLALILAGVGRGDEVWVSTFTFVAAANAVAYTGADLRFVDSEWSTWNMDPDLLAEALDDAATEGRLPKAVVVVHLYGQCARIDEVARICERHEVVLIEDAAESLGATWRDRHAGTWGHYGAYSFNGNKIITTSGGGMLVGPPEEMERARYLASQARRPTLHYEHTEVGHNYRLSNILAAMGRAQLERLPRIIERCHQINTTYRRELGDIDGIGFMPWDGRGRPNGWLTVMFLDRSLLDAGVTPAELCASLAASDIEARPAWKPMHRQPAFDGVPVIGGAVADEIFEYGLCLPSGSGLTESDQGRVIEAVRKAVRGAPGGSSS